MEVTEQRSQTVRKQTKMDRRQKKTRRAIYQAFEELMSTQHYSAVTVAQIIERADIGRSTFYSHFETKDELLQDMCEEMFDHIFEGVNDYCVTHADLQTADLQGKLAHLLYHLRDTHSGICGKLIMEGEPYFTAYFRTKLGTLFRKEMPLRTMDVPEDLAIDMHTSAFCESITWWFRNDANVEPEQLAAWFCEFQPQ